MRLFRYQSGAGPAIGADLGGRCVSLISLDPTLPDTIDSIAAGGPAMITRIIDAAKNGGGEALDLDKVELLTPFPAPGKILCIGLNYADHAKETNLQTTEFPTVFTRFRSTLIGPEAPLIRPRVSEQFDYEVELVAVIGKHAHYVPREEALGYVAGYTIANDVSVRDYQFATSQFTIGKNFDGSCPVGPVFVTADSLPPGGRGLKIVTRLNGNVVQSDTTSNMIFDTATLVHKLSEVMTLEPGDIILTGTPSGIGWSRKPQLFMKEGDVCECEIEGIGVLKNFVKDEI